MKPEREPDKSGNEHSGHRQRMRARIMQDGVDSLAEHEVLEVLLYAAVPRIVCSGIMARWPLF